MQSEEVLTVQHTKEELEKGLAELQAKRQNVQLPSVGRVVHYVLPGGHSRGQHRPAVIVRVWNAATSLPVPLVQLQVFTDGTNDFTKGQPGADGTLWVTSAHYSETPNPDTWHWPEKV